MKRLFFGLLALSCAMQATPRPGAVVTGIMKESTTGAPMEFASVVLRGAVTGNAVDGCMTDSTGVFRFEELPAGEYYVEGSYVGCPAVCSDTLTLRDGQTADIGTLFLSESTQLEGIVVEGRKPAFVAKLDRKVFDVARDLTSAAGSAGDIMQNIPSVEVDMDGNVSLRGSSNVTILINGKPSAMMGKKTRADALAQISASAVERIEIITSPSAEYRPDGTSGIINIVLKKDAVQGMNGALSANVGSHGRQNAGVSLNYGINGINVFGGYTFRRDRYDRSIADHRVSPSDVIDQTTTGLGRPVSHAVRLGMNASLTSHDMLEIAAGYNRRRFRRNESMESVTRVMEGDVAASYSRDRDAVAMENGWEATARYSHRYGEDNEWGADYTYTSESEDEMNRYTTVRTDRTEKDNEAVWDAQRLHAVSLHWRHRLSEHAGLAAGYGLERLRAEQSYHVEDWNGGGFVPNVGLSSDFVHTMTLNSLYATTDIAAGRWNVSAGIRGEYVLIRNKLVSQQRDIARDYISLYPSVRVSRPVGGDNELTVSYSMRVNRPEGSDMNPFAERINPLSLSAGNPYLKPEKIHSLEAGWLWRAEGGSSLLSTLYYRYVTNRITEVSRYIDTGVLLTTKENMNSGQDAGMELIWTFPAARWCDFSLNMNGYYNRIDASGLGFAKARDAFSWSALFNADFRPLAHWMVQLNARYRSATLVPQGRRDADVRVDMGMKYDIPSIGLAITASVTDMLDTYRKSFTLDTPQLKQKVEKRRNPRIIYVGLSWQFGKGKSRKHSAAPEYDESM